MRAILAGLFALSLTLVPTALSEARDTSFQAIGGTVWSTWGVAGAQIDDDTAIGARYWQNATSGSNVLTLYVTVCLRLESGAGYCDGSRFTRERRRVARRARRGLPSRQGTCARRPAPRTTRA